MRGLAPYLLSGFVVVIALDFLAPPSGRLSAATLSNTAQSVNRANKADRIPLPVATVGKRLGPNKAPAILAGCEPVFSPLSASARANFAGRCLA